MAIRALFFGMSGAFSRGVLEALLEGGVTPAAIFVARSGVAGVAPLPPPRLGPGAIPLAGPPAERTIADLGWERGIPVSAIGRPDEAAIAAIAALRPDVGCVACFPHRVPAALLALPPNGFLNVHPSLLPKHRGPEPLFWMFHDGDTRAGVTIHTMDEGLDSGEIVAQQAFDLPDGVTGAQAERATAALGGRLLAVSLAALEHGSLPRRSQPPGGGYQPAPGEDDFTIDTGWTARRAFNFMRGTAEWGVPYRVTAGEERLALAAARSFEQDARLPQPFVSNGDDVAVAFSDGVLHAVRAAEPQRGT